jgi:myo-inositol-1(or 4)-monophosphatase
MHIHDLQDIGAFLFKEISSLRHSSAMKTAEGIGAGGDKTHYIDRFAEEVIISRLEALNEPLTIISEEAGVMQIRGGGTTVLIDPIDGSRNAVAGIPFYATSIAVAEGMTIGDVHLAFVINLVNGDQFWAGRGQKGFFHGIPMESQQTDDFSLIAYEATVPSKDLPIISPLLSHARKARCLGATALDLSYLACGAISVFTTPSPSRSFDFGAGYLLVKESGGVVTDIHGDSLQHVELGLKKSSSLLAAGNPRLHTKALSLLNP